MQTGLTRLSATLSRFGYVIYQIGLKSDSLPPMLGRPLRAICRLVVLFVQKTCEAMLVLFIHPEMGYDPVKQRLIDKRREIAGRLTGISEGELTRGLRARIEQNLGRDPLLPVRPQAPAHKSGHTEACPDRFGVVIPFYRHLDFFTDCVRSVATAAESLGTSQFNLVIVNDDPTIANAELESRIPGELQSVTQVLGNKQNLGIARTLNRGISASQPPWLLLLDCDDKIHPRCFDVLRKWVQQKPDASYLSSQMTLINDRDQFLGYHFRYRTVLDHTDDLAASHLKIYRRDLFDEIGYHNPQYDGCQDYELALRIAIQKRIDLIPEFLYVYRWHTQNQGVSASARQNTRRKKISQVYRLLVFALTSGKTPIRIDGDGPFRDAWLERLPRPTPESFLTINLPFTSDWSLPRMIYLLADGLGIVYSLYLEGSNTSIHISLPSDYLSRLCSTCCDFVPAGK
jgi:glycosyltransferase involved in cell wall biosynthesis